MKKTQMHNFPRHPAEIAAGSFEIIRRELTELGHQFPPDEAAIIERIVHSTADFEFAELTRFSPAAIQAGVAVLRVGGNVVTDVNMVRVGVSQPRLAQFGGAVHCLVADPTTRERAVAEGTTRSAMGIRIAAEQGWLMGGIAVVGNAPTALYELIELVARGIKPALIIGVPVGFVSTVESKEALQTVTDVPWMTTVGRKGGSPVAVAMVNALLRLAEGTSAASVD